ncbi:hypothetical protein SDC9_151435 [bioreactor metagenome]|uniref:Uncharacterized protein n=1 Tax=bioreactor metagenome TaxID=1076179 RepID=A0A645ESM6_9ZZZZ
MPNNNLSSIIELPTTLETTSNACMSGIPEDNKVDSVLVNLDVTSMVDVPLTTGNLSLRLSKNLIPSFVLKYMDIPTAIAITTARYIYQYVCNELLKFIKNCVGPGNAAPLPSNIPTNVGIINTSINTTTATETTTNTAGYTIADFTLFSVLFSFSKCSAILSIMVSKLPLTSPASTMLMRMVGNISLCIFIDSERVEPFCTSSYVSAIAFLKDLFAVCATNISRQGTMPSPALIMV